MIAAVCSALRKERSYAALLEEMSPDLRGKVMVFSFSNWLSVVPFFQLNTIGLSIRDASNAEAEYGAFMQALAPCVRPVLFPPLEAILRPQQVCTSMYVFSSVV